jgi:hypothetical protein
MGLGASIRETRPSRQGDLLPFAAIADFPGIIGETRRNLVPIRRIG